MGFDITGLGSFFDFSGKVLDKIFPDKAEAERAKLKLFEMQQNGEFKELDARFSAIVAEANSQDPWTSRARPSFSTNSVPAKLIPVRRLPLHHSP